MSASPQRSRPTETDRDLSLGILAGIVGYHVAQAAVTTYGTYERHIGKPFHLRKAEFSLLMLLLANGPVPPKRLAAALSLTAPNLTLMLDRLQSRGLLRRERNPMDGRSQHILLTDKGLRMAHDAAAVVPPMERELLTRLSPAEHAMLIELLAKLAT
jgi:DNA-binding MarR family transcriptional regulator